MDRFIKNLARGAGQILREGFKSKFEIKPKTGFWDVVTKYDLAAEKYIVGRIQKKFPSHGIMGEEGGQIKKGKRFWVIDPIDGTLAFSRGIAQFCTAIAFVENNQISYSVVYDPVLDELFFAKKQKGAYLNNTRISVGEHEELRQTLISIGFASQYQKGAVYKNFFDRGIYSSGGFLSMDLVGAYVAMSRFDGVISRGANPWDYAPCALLIKEAGGKVTDYFGKPYQWNSDGMVAGNPQLHKKMMAVLKKT